MVVVSFYRVSCRHTVVVRMLLRRLRLRLLLPAMERARSTGPAFPPVARTLRFSRITSRRASSRTVRTRHVDRFGCPFFLSFFLPNYHYHYHHYHTDKNVMVVSRFVFFVLSFFWGVVRSIRWIPFTTIQMIA